MKENLYMDKFEKLVIEMKNENPFLYEIYHNFMAGEFDKNRITSEYVTDENFRNKIDALDKKFLPILREMGL